MARPRKKGMEYFPLDIDFFENDKIQLTESEFGVNGSYIALRLFCAIYAEGYYYTFGEDECRLLSRKTCGIVSPDEIMDIVGCLIKRGLFDKEMFDQYGILTSKGIQERYLFVYARTKRLAEIDKRYNLLPVDDNGGNDEETNSLLGGNKDLNGVNSEFGTQKEKEKEKENKENNTIKEKTEPPDRIPYYARKKEEEKDVSELSRILTEDNGFYANVCLLTPVTKEVFKYSLDYFARYCKSEGKDIRTMSEYKTHFKFWLAKKKSDMQRAVTEQCETQGENYKECLIKLSFPQIGQKREYNIEHIFNHYRSDRGVNEKTAFEHFKFASDKKCLTMEGLHSVVFHDTRLLNEEALYDYLRKNKKLPPMRYNSRS